MVTNVTDKYDILILNPFWVRLFFFLLLYLSFFSSPHLAKSQPRLRRIKELNACTTNSRFTRLHNGGLEDYKVSFFPHLGLECLPRQHNSREAHFHALIRAEVLEDMFAGDAQKAESMQDGIFESTDFAELGVEVKRVSVAIEAIEGRLVF